MSWLEDRLEILNLIASYSHAADGLDPEAYADCFTEDGAFVGLVGGRPHSASYSASKFALVGYSETLYVHFIPKGIGVSVLCPGGCARRCPTMCACQPRRRARKAMALARRSVRRR